MESRLLTTVRQTMPKVQFLSKNSILIYQDFEDFDFKRKIVEKILGKNSSIGNFLEIEALISREKLSKIFWVKTLENVTF